MQDAFIVSALRTPLGKKKGTLSNIHPADLGAVVLSATFDQIDLDPGLVEDVIFGCVDTCLLYTSPSPRDATLSRMPSSA